MNSILERLHHIDTESLGWWLCERQLPSGGLNGRPEKLLDVCYCWWVLASLKIIGKIDWIDSEKLKKFIFACQVNSFKNRIVHIDFLATKTPSPGEIL